MRNPDCFVHGLDLKLVEQWRVSARVTRTSIESAGFDSDSSKPPLHRKKLGVQFGKSGQIPHMRDMKLALDIISMIPDFISTSLPVPTRGLPLYGPESHRLLVLTRELVACLDPDKLFLEIEQADRALEADDLRGSAKIVFEWCERNGLTCWLKRLPTGRPSRPDHPSLYYYEFHISPSL